MRVEDVVVPDNYPKVSAANQAAVALSIVTIGLQSPIIVDRKGNLIDGLARLNVYKTLGVEFIPDHRAFE